MRTMWEIFPDEIEADTPAEPAEAKASGLGSGSVAEQPSAKPSAPGVAEHKKSPAPAESRSFQVVPEKTEPGSFSFSPVNAKTNTINTDNNSGEKPDFKEEFRMSDKTDIGDLIQSAEDVTDVALALEAALVRDGVHWSSTAKILSGLLRDHTDKLKNFTFRA